MLARVALVVGLGLSVGGCLLPTPFSFVSMGADVVSYMATGKAVTDHGVSLAMGEDCALVRILDGQICHKPVVYEHALADAPLEPLPDAVDGRQLAAVHPEVRAAIVRASQYDGWAGEGIQVAMLPGSFVADDLRLAALPPTPAADRESSGLGFGDLISSITGGLSPEAYREPTNRADGGRGPEPLLFGQQVRAPIRLAPIQLAESPSQRGSVSFEVGTRPEVASRGRLLELDLAPLVGARPTLRMREIDG